MKLETGGGEIARRIPFARVLDSIGRSQFASSTPGETKTVTIRAHPMNSTGRTK
jgi:hypothetical protein